jgi:hypothetical protein
MGNELSSPSIPRTEDPIPSSSTSQSLNSNSTIKMAGPPTRTQPSRPNKRKADDPPVHCRKCETSHSPYQGCSLSTFRQKAKASASESDADEDEHVNAGVDEDDDEEDIQLPPAAKKSKKSSVRGGGKKKRKNVEDEVVDICECEGMNHKIKAECEREQLRKTHVEVSFW